MILESPSSKRTTKSPLEPRVEQTTQENESNNLFTSKPKFQCTRHI